VTEPNVVSRVGAAVWRKRNPQWAAPPSDRIAPHLELSARSLPRYAVDRGVLAVNRRIRGIEGQPWITARSMVLLDGLLRPTDQALEFGSGGSTEWVAQRVGLLRSVEAADHWYTEVAKRIAQRGLDNVLLELVSSGELGYESDAHRAAYVNAHPDIEVDSLDLVFVDGEYRDACALRGIDLLRPGGILVLDNANSYLPSTSRTPWKVSQPASEKWVRFTELVAGWRHIWTSNGSWDTALWLKP
jgi:predicted O-methyltransferase YrrM